MQILKSLLQYIPSEIGMLVAWIVFIAGLGAGLLLAWPFKRKTEKDFGEEIVFLQNELRNIDTEIGKLWTITFPPHYRRVPTTPIKAQPVDKKTSSTVDLLNVRKMLEGLANNVRSITHNLGPRLQQNKEPQIAYVPAPEEKARLDEPHRIQ